MMTKEHKDVLSTYLSSEKKLQRYKRKLTDYEKILYEKTKEYIEARAAIINQEYRKIVQQELEYKVAFRDVQDYKAKINDMEHQVLIEKKKFDEINEKVENQIKNLKHESDKVFKGIVEKMAYFYNEVQDGTNKIKN